MGMPSIGVRRAKAEFLSGFESNPAILLKPEAIRSVMEVTKWLKPSVGYRSQTVPECPLNKYELDVHQHLVNISYWTTIRNASSARFSVLGDVCFLVGSCRFSSEYERPFTESLDVRCHLST